MKKILLIAFSFITMSLSVFAQDTLKINSDFTSESLTINNTTFTKKSTLADYEKVLGKADRIEKVAGKDKFFVYDKLGISIILNTNTNIIDNVIIAYIFDDDRKVAKESFKGTLAINGTTITNQTMYEEIEKLSTIKLLKIMTGFYIGKGKIMHLMVYYIEKNLGQLTFSFEKIK